jgi:hypothetical protein
MANLDGEWSLVFDSTPLGIEKGVLTVKVASSGASFTGSFSGAMADVNVEDGKVDGDALTWKMSITVPIPTTLNCAATVTGDTMTGTCKVVAFGSYPFTGSRL